MVAPILVAILISDAPVNTTAGVPEQQPPPTAQEKPEAPWPPAGVFRLGPEVPPPKLIKETSPNLGGIKVQGTVILEAVVQTDGTVGEVRVVRSLDKKHGLDDEVVKTVKKWRFTPGTKDGTAVPVLISVEMTFVRR